MKKIKKQKFKEILERKKIPDEVISELLDSFKHFTSEDLESIMLILDSEDQDFLRKKQEEYFIKMADAFSNLTFKSEMHNSGGRGGVETE